MTWQDVAAALNKLPVPKRSRRQAQQRFRERRRRGLALGYSSPMDLPATEVEHDTAMWEHGVPGPVVYQHVVGPVHPYLRLYLRLPTQREE